MKSRLCWSWLTILILASLPGCSSNTPPASTSSTILTTTYAAPSAGEKKSSNSVRSFTQLPLGYLGVPLGTVVRVTGVTIHGDELQLKSAMGKTYLRIETVNGKPLDETVDFEFPEAEQIPKPAIGTRFDYQVHESGEFSGHVDTRPDGDNIEVAAVAHDGFYYRRALSIHRPQPK
ncbi:MAG: hypothetical protein ACRC8S_03370 [Fimbriiglobus sp.]